mmetsp:Transcript_85271/g.117695  ORF Transcript_85271/g.117695 Transcript_85271/m.117695 type:complete len:91 (-) Transcript_85271:127-399(-)
MKTLGSNNARKVNLIKLNIKSVVVDNWSCFLLFWLHFFNLCFFILWFYFFDKWFLVIFVLTFFLFFFFFDLFNYWVFSIEFREIVKLVEF